MRGLRKLNIHLESPTRWFIVVGAASYLGWGLFVWISQAFGPSIPTVDRPLPITVGLLALWLGLRVAVRR